MSPLDSPWQDTITERDGWRQRAANLKGEKDHPFAVDYPVCHRYHQSPSYSPARARAGTVT
ncbi:hypothetical protein [Streptomyces zagrosensis]|uniref:Uncharacterized protein n=1 Tax=Streptomyces zagrosensis TaxID=1042984 RepID=A0A7W9QE36_9ACTN|nr:hypothetical protein [Streptomyces zagrosensis]MBB5938606.1 hypothetical protein [Streptomyces zagrosensis]